MFKLFKFFLLFVKGRESGVWRRGPRGERMAAEPLSRVRSLEARVWSLEARGESRGARVGSRESRVWSLEARGEGQEARG